MTAPAPLAVVMLGCGAFARYYHVPALLADPTIHLAAIFDPHPAEATRALAQQTGAILVPTLAALPDPAGPTMAIVTTPHALHAGHAAAALARGWHVLCDKPFVLHTAQARALSADATQRRRVNAVAFNRRFDAGCRRAREIIRAGGIGPVRYVQTVQLGYESRGWFLDPELSGGGPFTGRATHMADIVPWLLDRAPTQVRARLRQAPAGRIDRGGVIDVLFGETECQMTCLEEGWHMWDEVRVFGADGLIELRRPLAEPIGWALTARTRRGSVLEALAADPSPGDATRDFCAALRTGSPVGCSFADAVTATAIIEQAYASARDGGTWLSVWPSPCPGKP